MTALVTLKTTVHQQSAPGSSLKVVLVLVQCMRPYTATVIVLSRGCSTVEYTNVAGRRQYTTQSWKALLIVLARRIVTDHISILITV